MAAAVKFLLKIFLIFGLLFGLLMQITPLLLEGIFDLKLLIISSIFFGGFMALFIGGIHLIKLRSAGVKKFTDEDFKVKQSAVVLSDLTLEEIAQKLHSIFWKVNIGTDKISAVGKSSIWSWAERIEIIKQNTSGNQFQYEVSSRPILPFTLADYGKNRENVLKIRNLIES